MLEVKNLTIQRQNRHLFSDVCFALDDIGFTYIHCDDQEASRILANILGGYAYSNDTIYFQDQCINLSNEEDLAKYRQNIASMICKEWIIIENQTVLENIVLDYKYSIKEINDVLERFELYEYRHNLVEISSFEIQIKTILARMFLRKTSIWIFIPQSTPYTKEEISMIYQQLKMVSAYRMIIVFDDADAKSYSDHTIECIDGRIISDSLPKKQSMIMHKSNVPPFNTFNHLIEEMFTRYRLPYFCLKCFMIITLILTSILWSTGSMNILDIETGMLNKQDRNYFSIKKYAYGNDGTRYDMEALMQEEDLEELSVLPGTLLNSYLPINVSYANAYLEGIYNEDYPKYNNYPVMELKSPQQLSIDDMIGEFPKTFDQVMLPQKLAETFFSQPLEEVIHKKISWYGLPLEITGIFMDNIEDEYECLYVLEGYIKQHPLSKMKVFPSGYKRCVYDKNQDTIAVSDYQILSDDALFYDGKQIVGASLLQSNEVVLDVSTVMHLGFPYEDVAQNENMSYLQKLAFYYAFSSQYVGLELQLQAYSIDSDPTNSMFFDQKVKVAGFMIPNMNTLEYVTKPQQGIVYTSKELLKNQLVPNLEIQNVAYSSDYASEQKISLAALQNMSKYSANLNNSLLLDLLVIDFKELFSFFVFSSIFFFFICIYLYILLMKKCVQHMYDKISIYYQFGYSKKQIIEDYIRNLMMKMRGYLKVCLLCSWIVLGLYFLLILTRLSANISILFYLILPVFIYFAYEIVFLKVSQHYLKRTDICDGGY